MTWCLVKKPTLVRIVNGEWTKARVGIITACETNIQWAISRIYAHQITILMKFKKILPPLLRRSGRIYIRQRINYELHRRFGVTSSTHQTLKLHNNL